MRLLFPFLFFSAVNVKHGIEIIQNVSWHHQSDPTPFARDKKDVFVLPHDASGATFLLLKSFKRVSRMDRVVDIRMSDAKDFDLRSWKFKNIGIIMFKELEC